MIYIVNKEPNDRYTIIQRLRDVYNLAKTFDPSISIFDSFTKYLRIEVNNDIYS